MENTEEVQNSSSNAVNGSPGSALYMMEPTLPRLYQVTLRMKVTTVAIRFVGMYHQSVTAVRLSFFLEAFYYHSNRSIAVARTTVVALSL